MIQTRKEEQTFQWINVAKGIGILLVLLGHSIRDDMRLEYAWIDNLYSFIYYFHMPLFFLISGFLFENSQKKRYCFKEIVYKKYRTLLLPYISYTVIIYLVFQVFAYIPQLRGAVGNKEVYSFTGYLVDCIKGNNPYAFHLWYLLALFLMQIFSFISVHLLKGLSKKYRDLISFTLAALLYIVAYNVFPTGKAVDLMIVNLFMKTFVFFELGRILYNIDIKCPRKGVVVSCVVVMVFSWIYISCYQYTGHKMVVYEIQLIFELLSKCALIWGLVEISIIIAPNALLEYLGKRSFVIYLLHQPFVCAVLGSILYGKLGMGYVFTIIICVIMSVLVPLAVVEIEKKSVLLSRFFERCLNIK